jgi:hypothetical protein
VKLLTLPIIAKADAVGPGAFDVGATDPGQSGVVAGLRGGNASDGIGEVIMRAGGMVDAVFAAAGGAPFKPDELC